MARTKNPNPSTPTHSFTDKESSAESSPNPSSKIAIGSGSETESVPVSTPAKSTRRKQAGTQQKGGSSSTQKLYPERGFVLEDTPESMRTTLTTLEWEKFATHPSFQPSIPLIREFYQGIPETNEQPADYSITRRKLVAFDSKLINQHLGMSYEGRTFNKALNKTDQEGMEEIKRRVAKAGVDWVKNRGSDWKLKRTDLIEEAKLWMFLICTKIIPSTHVTYIDRQRLILLDLIMRGVKVDIGRIVEGQIKECQGKKGGYLFFPCLIQELCIKAGLEVREDEERCPLVKQIDAQTMERCRGGPARAGGSGKIETEGVAGEHQSRSVDAVARNMLQQLEKKMVAYWGFQKHFTQWQVENWDNGLKMLNLPPVFPDWILPDDYVPPPKDERWRKAPKENTPSPAKENTPPPAQEKTPTPPTQKKSAPTYQDKGKAVVIDSPPEKGILEDLDPEISVLVKKLVKDLGESFVKAKETSTSAATQGTQKKQAEEVEVEAKDATETNVDQGQSQNGKAAAAEIPSPAVADAAASGEAQAEKRKQAPNTSAAKLVFKRIKRVADKPRRKSLRSMNKAAVDHARKKAAMFSIPSDEEEEDDEGNEESSHDD